MTIPKINQITIRTAVSEDAELLAKIGRETFHDAFADHPLMPQKDLRFSGYRLHQSVWPFNGPPGREYEGPHRCFHQRRNYEAAVCEFLHRQQLYLH